MHACVCAHMHLCMCVCVCMCVWFCFYFCSLSRTELMGPQLHRRETDSSVPVLLLLLCVGRLRVFCLLCLCVGDLFLFFCA